jgi:acyl-[acyl-carrier-protein]-phospholipid O-acyltransferase/long-chain-fatty-acid--[acyl-carrier-protein] ligase
MLSFAAILGELETGTIILLTALAVVAGLIILFWFRPGLLVRIPVWIICHTFYGVRVIGRHHIPRTGPALLVCNHVSYLDFLFLLQAQSRHIHFVIFASWTRILGLRHLLKWGGVIPIDQTAGPRAIVKSLRLAADVLAKGGVVCIFAEGRFTRTGFLLPFTRGFERIVEQSPAPIIPVCLEQVWGSVFSYWGGKLIWKWPHELPYPVYVVFGEPMPATAQAAEVRLAVQKLSADCAIRRSSDMRPVHRQFVRMAARHPFRPCIFDPLVQKDGALSYGKILIGAICLARALRSRLGTDEKRVGVWLPPGAPAALANIALALLGKVSVNLNYTASPDVVQSAARQCALRHVITSKRFTQRVPLEPGPGVEPLFIEEIMAQVTRGQKVRTTLSVFCLPRFVLERWVLGLASHQPDDLVTVIFSSGSTGDPKGVMLSHRNIAANTESITQTIAPRPKDCVLGILPFFHSFGYTVTLWVPLQIGASAVYHADPRQSREIGQSCREHGCTIFLVTPTFLRLCLKRCEPGDFASLRFLWCGAEKLAPNLSQEFQEKFDVMPMEGYGCTELSPAAIVNVPDQDLDGFRQIGNKPGTIGQPMPGIAARIVDPETYVPLAVGKEGLLLIRGANVMVGYLGRPEATFDVIRDGWYVTGDIARMDEDGFITLTDRLSRFSKIGGEMVPHQKIEDEVHAILCATDGLCVVTAVPDEAKGERLIVLHVGIEVAPTWQQLSKKGLPNLWLPRERDFFQVPELPILGTGKVDLKKCKEIAVELTNERGT